MINSDILQDVALLSGGYPQRFGNRTGAEIDFRLREGSRDRTHAPRRGQRHQRFGGLRRPDRKEPARVVAAVGPAELHRSDHPARSIRRSEFRIQRHAGQVGLRRHAGAAPRAVDDCRPLSRHREGRRRRRRSTRSSRDATPRGSSIAGWHARRSRGGLFAVRALASVNPFSNTAADEVAHRRRPRPPGGRVGQMAACRRAAHVYVEAGADRGVDRGAARAAAIHRGELPHASTSSLTTRCARGGYAQARIQAGRLTVVPGVRADHWIAHRPVDAVALGPGADGTRRSV